MAQIDYTKITERILLFRLWKLQNPKVNLAERYNQFLISKIALKKAFQEIE